MGKDSKLINDICKRNLNYFSNYAYGEHLNLNFILGDYRHFQFLRLLNASHAMHPVPQHRPEYKGEVDSDAVHRTFLYLSAILWLKTTTEVRKRNRNYYQPAREQDRELVSFPGVGL